MANIRKEKNRHDWERLRVHLGDHEYKLMHLCCNCQLRWDEDIQGPPPPTGCPYEVRMRNLGRSRIEDIEDQVIDHTGSMIGGPRS